MNHTGRVKIYSGNRYGRIGAGFGYLPASSRHLVENMARTPGQLELIKDLATAQYRSDTTARLMGLSIALEGFFKFAFHNPTKLMVAALESRRSDALLYELAADEWFERMVTSGPLKEICDPYVIDYFDTPNALSQWMEEKSTDNFCRNQLGVGLTEQRVPAYGRRDPAHFLAIDETVERLYESSLAARHIIVRELLTNRRNGLLIRSEAMQRIFDLFMSVHVDVEQDHLPEIGKITRAVLASGSLEDQYFLFAPVLARNMFIRPSVSSVTQNGLIFERVSVLFRDLNDRILDKHISFDGYDGDYGTYGEALVRKISGYAFSGFASPNSDELIHRLFGEQRAYESLPAEFRMVPGAPPIMTEIAAIRELAEQFGSLGCRFLQLLGQYADIPSEMREEFSKVYDRVQGQSKLTAWETIKREAPDLIGPNDEIGELIGGGSLVSVYSVKKENGDEYVLKVLYPQARYKVLEMTQWFDRALDLLIESCPGNITYRMIKYSLLPDLTKWLLNDIDDERFGENDIKFRGRFNGFRPDGFSCSIYIPKSHEPSTKYLKAEEYVPGTNLTELKIGQVTDFAAGVVSEEDRKQIVSLIVRNYLAQITDRLGLVHSDAHEGNFRVMPDGNVAVLDRNLYLELDGNDRDFVKRFTSLPASLDLAGVASSKIRILLEYLVSLPENTALSGKITDLEGLINGVFSTPEKLKTLLSFEGVSELLVLLKREGVSVPLNLTLLLKNLNALNRLSTSAGFSSLAEASLHNPKPNLLQRAAGAAARSLFR